jgi:alcohol dehydrogenase
MIADFIHRSSSAKVMFRPGALSGLAAEIAALGIRRPLAIASGSAWRSAIGEAVRAQLQGFKVAELVPVPPHSSRAAVADAVERARRHDADGFVAVGGGSASDTAKAAALWLAEGGTLESHATVFVPPTTLHVPDLRAPKLPIVAVPCTASAAEVTPSMGIRVDGGHKLLFSDPAVACRLIVFDPAANVSVPAPLMLSTGMNGLAHCLEGLYSKVRTPATTALALHAIGEFTWALPAVAREPGSVDARAALLSAAWLSGLVLANARSCLHHAICHALGASTGIAHGDANAVMLPHVLAFNAGAAAEEMAAAARAIADARGGRDRSGSLASLVRDLAESIGVPTRLRDLGVRRDSLAAVAAATLSERGLMFNPRPVAGANEVEALLDAAW